LPEQVRRFATAAHLFFLEMTAEIQEDPIPVFVRKPGLFPALNKALPRSRLQRFRGSFLLRRNAVRGTEQRPAERRWDAERVAKV